MKIRKKISQVAKENKVTYRTVWNWVKLGKISFEQDEKTRTIFITEEKEVPDNVAIYCRVSSSENKINLETQKERVLNYCYAKGYTVSKVVCEIGSGLNDNRKKLELLLLDRSIDRIVVEHLDRFSRFGNNYIITLLNMQGRELEVINKAESSRDDLMGDFVAIITSFAARLYGQRRNKRRTEEIIKMIESDK